MNRVPITAELAESAKGQFQELPKMVSVSPSEMENPEGFP
jgi:hypothetical protein